MSMSPDANRILALPHARHPWLHRFVNEIAANPKLNINDAAQLIDTAMTELKLTQLDIEMVQPGSDARLGFEVSVASPQDGFKDRVNHHVQRLLPGGRDGPA